MRFNNTAQELKKALKLDSSTMHKIAGVILFLLITNPTQVFGQKTMGLIKKKPGSIEKGYVLFAPLYCKTTYLIDKCGNKINSWESKYMAGYSAYLQPDGSLIRAGHSLDTFLEFGGKGGIIEKFSWDGKLLWSYNISSDSVMQHHDFYPMDNGNILLIAWHAIPIDKAEANGRQPGTILTKKLISERILEIKPKGTNNAEIVWQWSLWDHLVQDRDPLKSNFGDIGQHPELFDLNYGQPAPSDWIHLNSIDYNKELDQIVVSNHHQSEIWIIDHSTTKAEAASHSGGKYGKGGDFLYRWGNPEVYKRGMSNNQTLFKQHNAHWIPNGYKNEGDIMIFNNGNGRDSAYSTVDIVAPPVSKPGYYLQDIPYGPEKPKWTYKDSVPSNFFSAFQSSAQLLFNGHLVICGGPQGRLFEVDNLNKIVWEYINPVSKGDTILKDGTIPMRNSVFKCIYYGEDYNAFKGKNLDPKLPIELNSIPSFCQDDKQRKKKKCSKKKAKK
jgi:hypothetical protein